MRCPNPLCQNEIPDACALCPICGGRTGVSAPSSASRCETVGVLCRACVGPNPADARVCIHCGAALLREAGTVTEPPPMPFPKAVVSPVPPSMGVTEPTVVLRASDQMWHAEEAEDHVVPGQPRPLVVLDEQVVHLSQTHRRLEPALLLHRVQQLLARDDVPVEVTLVAARWQRDGQEMRPRLIACLRDQPNRDIKMLLGVDYLGNWASIQMHLAIAPEILPPPPPKKKWMPPVDALLAVVFGVLTLVVFIGLFLLAFGVWRLWTSWQQHQAWLAGERGRLERERDRLDRERARERLTRTFKVDDMRLFCSAMREIFQAVVDDIVEQGGEVSRIEGGQGGFFQVVGLVQPADSGRKTDAALAAV